VSTRATIVIAFFAVVLAKAAPARAWNDATGSLDMPWMGSGERARLFTENSTCIMCPTGYTHHRSWGRSGRAGADPYDEVDRALRFLKTKGVLDAWPAAIAEGTVSDGTEVMEPRAAPYRFTIVMIEPMVVVMSFDLGALVKIGDVDADQAIGTPRLNQAVVFGTRVPASGTLLWFSPDGDRTPIPVALRDADHGEIVVKGLRLALERRDDAWSVLAPERHAQ
jgi:hypothetical protein